MFSCRVPCGISKVCEECSYIRNSIITNGLYFENMYSYSSDKISKKYEFTIIYTVSGTYHDGWCSNSNDYDIKPKVEQYKIPIIDKLIQNKLTYKYIQDGLTYDLDEFIDIFGIYTGFYHGRVSCMRTSGVCRTSKYYTIQKVTVKKIV